MEGLDLDLPDIGSHQHVWEMMAMLRDSWRQIALEATAEKVRLLAIRNMVGYADRMTTLEEAMEELGDNFTFTVQAT